MMVQTVARKPAVNMVPKARAMVLTSAALAVKVTVPVPELERKNPSKSP